MDERTTRSLCAVFLAAQALGIGVWWCLLALRAPLREHFRPSGTPDAMLLAFWLPDLLLALLGSAVAARLVLRGSREAGFVLALTAGAMSYAALYCLALVAMAPETWLAAASMSPAAAITVGFARRFRCRGER